MIIYKNQRGKKREIEREESYLICSTTTIMHDQYVLVHHLRHWLIIIIIIRGAERNQEMMIRVINHSI